MNVVTPVRSFVNVEVIAIQMVIPYCKNFDLKGIPASCICEDVQFGSHLLFDVKVDDRKIVTMCGEVFSGDFYVRMRDVGQFTVTYLVNGSQYQMNILSDDIPKFIPQLRMHWNSVRLKIVDNEIVNWLEAEAFSDFVSSYLGRHLEENSWQLSPIVPCPGKRS